VQTLKNYFGYTEHFISPDLLVPLPVISAARQSDLAPVLGTTDNMARYVNYSIAMSKTRGFLYFAAANIDGALFKKVSRQDNWRKDDRIDSAYQWGEELYKASRSDFDRGHMVKREDVQWGQTVLEAQNAADSTFFYTNSVPQHADLNQKIWLALEDYILHTESVPNHLRIDVFTGPVLAETDPVFVTAVNGKEVKLPVLFWKVVVFTKGDGQLYRVGFLMGQRKLLLQDQIIRPETAKPTLLAELFEDFEDAETYQVNIAAIETLTGLTFPQAQDVYQDQRPVKLVLEEVDVPVTLLDSEIAGTELGYRISNLVL